MHLGESGTLSVVLKKLIVVQKFNHQSIALFSTVCPGEGIRKK